MSLQLWNKSIIFYLIITAFVKSLQFWKSIVMKCRPKFKNKSLLLRHLNYETRPLFLILDRGLEKQGLYYVISIMKSLLLFSLNLDNKVYWYVIAIMTHVYL